MELKDQTAIETALFVRWIYDAPKFGRGVKGNAAFSDTARSFTIDGFVYSPLDRMVSITSSTSSIRTNSDRLTITLTGITQVPNSPGADLARVLDRGEVRIPNSKIIVHRAFFNTETGLLLDLPENPIRRFTGFVNNFNLVESRDALTGNSVIAYQLNCVSYADFLAKKISGRKTGPDAVARTAGEDVDVIFNRVPRLKGFTLNWGG